VRAVLQADGSVPHRRVMHALDLLRQANIGKIAFGVVPPAASAATAGGP
jgi:biopolymer transport protein ExbD